MEEAEKLSETALKLGEEAGVHLAVDTGMCRIGMRPNRESAEMVLAMSRLPGLRLEGLFTHFARADERDKTSYEAQLQAYRDFVEYLRALGVSIPLKHCSNSAAILDGLDSNGLNMVRAGIALYGLYPSEEVDKNRVRLRPVMELKSAVTYIKDVEPGAAVSYGGTFVADRPMRVATIPVGYGDGYPVKPGRCADPGKAGPHPGTYLHGSVYGGCNGHTGGPGGRRGYPSWERWGGGDHSRGNRAAQRRVPLRVSVRHRKARAARLCERGENNRDKRLF